MALGQGEVEDGGGGDLIEVEGGVEGEEEARFHPMEKVHVEIPDGCKFFKLCW